MAKSKINCRLDRKKNKKGCWARSGWWDKVSGYYKIRLPGKGILPQHKVIVETFTELFPYPPIGEWYDGSPTQIVIDHIDRNTGNNSVQNLRRGTMMLNRWNRYETGICGEMGIKYKLELLIGFGQKIVS